MGNLSGILVRTTQLACSQDFPFEGFYNSSPAVIQVSQHLQAWLSVHWEETSLKTEDMGQTFYLSPTLMSLTNVPSTYFKPINTRTPKSFTKSVQHKRQSPPSQHLPHSLYFVMPDFTGLIYILLTNTHTLLHRIGLTLPLVNMQSLLCISFRSSDFIIPSPQTHLFCYCNKWTFQFPFRGWGEGLLVLEKK